VRRVGRGALNLAMRASPPAARVYAAPLRPATAS